MKIRGSIFAFALALPFLSVPGEAQRTPATPAAASAPTAIPSLVPYAGVAVASDGKPLAGEVGMTFLIYKEEQGGEPLWVESQTVGLDASGHYRVQLGAANANGLPSALFANGEARWLEVQIAGETPQARVLLASVPYALKAADAATLGGLPASAFALAASKNSTEATPAGVGANASSTVTTAGGVSGYLPRFSGATTIVDSEIFDTGTDVGIGTAAPTATLDVNGTAIIAGGLNAEGGGNFGGSLNILATGNATATAGKASQPLAFVASTYNSSSKAVVPQIFRWTAEPTGNDTASPSSALELLFSSGSGTPAATGLSINAAGQIAFASGQTFPGVGAGTITGVTAGSGLTGGGTSGNVTLNVNTGTLPTLAANNTYTGSNVFVPSLYEETDVNIDTNNRNPGNISPGLRLGNASGEGMASKRTSGGNQYGVDIYTGYSPRLSINASGQVAIGTGATFNGAQLQVQGAANTGVQGTSTSGSGVVGTNANTTVGTAGVLGVAGKRNTSGFTGIAGIWGDSSASVGTYGSSDQYAGVYGQSTNGPGVQGSSANSWAGRFSNSSSSATVYATNASSSGGSALYGVASGGSGIGLYANATASGGTGVLAYGDGNAVNGNSNGDVLDTAGVLGVAGSRTGVGGIAGVWGDAAQHVGVIGSSVAYSGVYGASTTSYGVQAFSANGAAVYGVSGSSLNPSLPGPIGIWGDITGVVQYGVNPIGAAVVGTATNAQAGYFANNSDSPTVEVFSYGGGYGVYQGDANFRTLEASSSNGTCGFGGNGDLTCTGQVKALATTGSGARTVETYSMQSPENWMEDFGSGTMENGRATVSIDAAFAETVSDSADYHVFLTPRGDSKGLYVTNATAGSFEVHESGGGRSTIGFDYRIVAKRRGFEAQRMVDVTAAMQAVKARNGLKAARFETKLPDGGQNQESQ